MAATAAGMGPRRTVNGLSPRPHEHIKSRNPKHMMSNFLSLWSLDSFFPHFFLHLFSVNCSSLLTFLICPRHMPCSHSFVLSTVVETSSGSWIFTSLLHFSHVCTLQTEPALFYSYVFVNMCHSDVIQSLNNLHVSSRKTEAPCRENWVIWVNNCMSLVYKCQAKLLLPDTHIHWFPCLRCQWRCSELCSDVGSPPFSGQPVDSFSSWSCLPL